MLSTVAESHLTLDLYDIAEMLSSVCEKFFLEFGQPDASPRFLRYFVLLEPRFTGRPRIGWEGLSS